MKRLLLTTIAAVVLVGCGESQQSADLVETKPAEPVAEAATPEPPTVKAPDISRFDFHKAIYQGNIEAAKQYIDAGADVNAKDMHGGAPLRYARDKEIVELLIAKGADVNAKAGLRETHLHRSAFFGRKEAAEILIANGADVNAKMENGDTPLDVAIKFKKTETADLLRKHGGKTGDELKAEGK